MPELLAYHNDQAIKDKYLSRVASHRKADELVKGQYWEDGKGCAVGCTLHSDDHFAYQTELGIPKVLAFLEDAIFEGLPLSQAMEWPERFLSAITPGSDLSMVWPKFAVWMLADPDHGVIRFAGSDCATMESIIHVAGLYGEWIEAGEKPDGERWAAARAAAGAAAWAAGDARDAAWAAGSAARAARDARDAEWAAGAAAWAAGDAGDAAWITMADKLIELLEDPDA